MQEVKEEISANEAIDEIQNETTWGKYKIRSDHMLMKSL